MLCVVREYVQGIPLDRYAAQNAPTEPARPSPLRRVSATSLLSARQTPPYPSRYQAAESDRGPKGRAASHRFRHLPHVNKAAAEERSITARSTSPPPSSTALPIGYPDRYLLPGRADRWLLTGETALKSMRSKIRNRRLLRIVNRCTDLAPDMRFQSAERVKRSLQNADGHRQKRALRWACCLVACAACLCAGFAIGRYTDVMPAFLASSVVTFDERLIEQAIRLALHKWR